MNRSHILSTRIFRYGIILFTVLVLVGCAKKFFYNNLDWFVLEYVDDFVTLDEEQERLLEERVVTLIEWHKKEELPKYIDELKELETLEKSDVTLSYLQQRRDKIREYYDRIASKVAPELYSLSLQLSKQQQSEFLRNLQKHHKKKNDKYADKTEQEKREIVFDKTEERVNEWIGDLSKQQQAYVLQFSNQVILSSPLWRDYRSSIYREFEYLFENQPNVDIYQKVFMQLLFEPESFYSEQLSENTQHNLDLADQLTLSMTQSMTDKQWQHFYSVVKDWRVLAQDLLN